MSTAIMYYVLSRSMEDFLAYVKESKRDLQDCKYLSNEEEMKGFDFTSPRRELVAVVGWGAGRSGMFQNEAFRIISLYCRDKRVREEPKWKLGIGGGAVAFKE